MVTAMTAKAMAAIAATVTPSPRSKDSGADADEVVRVGTRPRRSRPPAGSAADRFSVADARPGRGRAGRRSGPASRRWRAVEQRGEGLEGAAAGGDLEHGADEDAVHVAHEGVGLDAELERSWSDAGSTTRRATIALEADVLGVRRREGGEVVLAGQGGGAGVQRVEVDRRAATTARGRGRTATGRRGGCGRGRRRRARGRRGGRRSPAAASSTAEHADVVGQQRVDRAQRAAARRRRRSRPGRARGRRRPCGRRRSAATGARSSVASARVSSPWTVRSPGWAAQPEKRAPSYSRCEL